MDDLQFQRRGTAAAAPLPGRVAAGGQGKPPACYDDVFGGPPRCAAAVAPPSLAPSRPEDYREIFGAAAACSIPVLDLPPPGDGYGGGFDFRQWSTLDYLDIFGGFDGRDFAVSYEQLFAPQDSNGVGAPLPSELVDAPPIANTSNSRLNGMRFEKQEMQVPGIVIKGQSRDQVEFSLNGVADHVNGSKHQSHRSNHMASWSGKNDLVNGIHKNQVHAVPGIAFVVEHTEGDKSHAQVDSDYSKGTSEGQHLLPTYSCSDVKCSENNMKAGLSTSQEHNTTYSSKNESTVLRSNDVSAMSNNGVFLGNFKNIERNFQNKTMPTVMSASPKNDLKVKYTASEDVPANEEHPSCSYSDHSTSSAKSFPELLADDISLDSVNIRTVAGNHLKKTMSGSPPCTHPESPNEDKTAEHLKADSVNIRIVEEEHLKKSMSGSPLCTHPESSNEDKKAEQKKADPVSHHPKNAPVCGSQHSHSSSTHSISSLDRSYSDSVFVTVSDINLRTQPSQGPPPARPPPMRPPTRLDLSERKLRRTLTDHQSHDVGIGVARKCHSFKHGVRVGSPPTFDVEMDASSAAAASVAAIEEAMELAQARLKSAKISMERKKESFQSRRKLGLNADLSINREEDEAIQENRTIREEVTIQPASEMTDGKGNAFATEKVATAFTTFKLVANFKEEGRNHGSNEDSVQGLNWGEAELSNLSNKKDKVGEWKVEEQFYELIQGGKKFNKVPESSLKEVFSEEKNAHELNKNGQLVAASKVTEWECASEKMQDSSLISKGQIKDSQKATQESYMQGECDLKLKESTHPHHQEKLEVQEISETEQETNWRTSEEAFICELSEKNMKGSNDASHVSAKGIHLKTDNRNHEDKNLKTSTKIDDSAYVHDRKEIERKDAQVIFEQDRRRMSVITHENELKATLEVHDWKGNVELFNVVQETCGCSSKTKKLKETQEFPIENEEELHPEMGKQNIPSMAGIMDDFEHRVTAAQGYYRKKINENTKEVQVVIKDVESAQDVCKGTSNEKKIDAQEAILLGDQWRTCKEAQEASENRDAGCPFENDSESQETDVNEEKMESDITRKFEEEKEREKRIFEEKERERINLEEEKESERIELEEEKEKERRKLEEAVRERRRLEAEKERERRKLEEEKERERRKLEEEKERERRKLEEETERERRKLEEEERERKLQEEIEKEREREKMEEERERERKKIEEEERRKKKLEEEERLRKKLEDEERERKKVEVEERKKEEERKKRMIEEEEMERRKLEEEESERRKLEEEEGRKVEEERERRKLEEEGDRRKIEEQEKSKGQEEDDKKRDKLEEKVREGKKQKEERERNMQEEEREGESLEEAERERRKLEEKGERERIEEEERERKLEEEKVREWQKMEEEKVREKTLQAEKEREWKKIEEKERERRKMEEEKERERIKLEEERDREREREKDRQAVERATREAHERAFAEARERAERAAVERVTVEARQRALAEARERVEKASAEALEKSIAEKASREARLRAERAAVERATAEARERAAEKAMAEKAAQDARERAEKFTSTSRDGVKQNANISNPWDIDPQFPTGTSNNSYQRYSDSSHHASFTNEKLGGSEGESAIRCKARMERHRRTIERAAKALAEKNLRDIIAQREQAERNRLAESLDADVKRWSNGKEGNLRALLSTLQYILGPESGWQPIPLTDVVTAPAVKKAYRKATLCVHPDKLQQRGASIQQKYVCEKVFDLLKEAWNKFNSEER